jgi:hypothetical protein
MYNKKVLIDSLKKLGSAKAPTKKPNIIYEPKGQLKYPGQNTRIPSEDITMQGVPYPVLGKPNIGQPQMMQPGQNYQFPGADYVDEYPQMKKGGRKKGLVSMPKPSKKGLMSKKYSRSLDATNKFFTQNYLFAKPKSRKNKVFDPNSKYYAEGGEPCPNGYVIDPITGDCIISLASNPDYPINSYDFESFLSPEEKAYRESLPLENCEDGRCEETDQIQHILDEGSYIPKKNINLMWDVVDEMNKRNPFGNAGPAFPIVNAGKIWTSKGAQSLSKRLGMDSPANCMWAAGMGYQCLPETKGKLPLMPFESNDKFINAVNKGTIPFSRVAKTHDPNFASQETGMLQQGDIINFKGGDSGQLSHAMTFSNYNDDGTPIFLDSNGQESNFGWNRGMWDQLVPNKKTVAYVSRFNPEKFYEKDIKILEEKARTNPTMIEKEYGGAQNGGDNTDAMNGMMKARLAYANEFGNPAAKRMINIPDNPYQFDNGDIGTHYMASIDNYAVPQIQDENGVLQLRDYGPESNEAIRFDSDEDANYFAENYKDVSPGFINQKQYGGLHKFVEGGAEASWPPKGWPPIGNYKGLLGLVKKIPTVNTFGNALKLPAVNWTTPSIPTLKREFNVEQVLKNQNFFPDENSFLNAVKNATVQEITPEIDATIGYRSGTTTKEQLLELSKTYASYPQYRNEGTIDAIFDGLKSGTEMEMPMVLQFPNGKKRVFSGNTRMDASRQLGINPNVLMLNVPDMTKLANPWQREAFPGLQYKSTMLSNPKGLWTQVAKDGTINVENALKSIEKESAGDVKVELLKETLGENIPKKMDFNLFRKKTQETIIPLETKIVDHSSNYGIRNVGYPFEKRDFFERVLEANTLNIAEIEKNIKNVSSFTKQLNSSNDATEDALQSPMMNHTPFDIPIYEAMDPNGFSQYFPTLEEAKQQEEITLRSLKAQLFNTINNSYNTRREMHDLPLENKTVIFSNKDLFGVGSDAHSNPPETLGHIHFLRDADFPDILLATQIQSDPFQSKYYWKYNINNETDALGEEIRRKASNIESRNDDIAQGMVNGLRIENTNYSKEEWEEKKLINLEEINELNNDINVLKEKLEPIVKKYTPNYKQKVLLDKNHKKRFFQEFLNYAANRGDVNYIAIPTVETSARIQNYAPLFSKTQPGPESQLIMENSNSFEEFVKKSEEREGLSFQDATEQDKYLLKKGYDLYKKDGTLKELLNDKRNYKSKHGTVLGNYEEYIKIAKKLGLEIEDVIIKGHTYKKIVIPEDFLKGVGEIDAYKKGGATNKSIEINLTPEEIKKYVNGGYIVEEIDNYQNGGTIYTVKGSKGYYKKVNGKWQVDWNKSGKYQPLSKGDVKARTAVLDKMAKPILSEEPFNPRALLVNAETQREKTKDAPKIKVEPISGSIQLKGDAYKKNYDDKGKEIKPITLTVEEGEKSREKKRKEDFTEMGDHIKEYTIDPIINTGKRIYNDPLKFASDIGTTALDISQLGPEAAMTTGSYLFGDKKNYFDVDTDALGTSFDALSIIPAFKMLKGSKNVIKGFKRVPKQLPGSPNAVSSADDVVKAGFDGNFLTRPLTLFTKNELTQGNQLYRKIGNTKGLQDLINKGGAQAPAPMRMNSGQMLDTPFFGIGNKPNENYGGLFAVETALPSKSKYDWSSRVGGTNNYGVAPIDPTTGRTIQNIPLEDLEVFRKKWFSNSYRKLDKQNLQKELKSANLQELSEKLYKWGIRGYIADQILNDGDLTGGKAVKIIEKYFEDGAKQYQKGGTNNNYVELDLTPKEIQKYVNGGYVVEELNDYAGGGSPLVEG